MLRLKSAWASSSGDGLQPGMQTKRDLDTGTTDKLHRGNAVSIIGRECDEFDRAVGGDRRHVEADTHIDALLFELWNEVSVNGRGRRPVTLSDDVTPELQD